MTERRHVHADLVSAPSIYFQLQQCELAECRINPLLNHVMGDRLAPLFTPGRHLGAMHAIAAYAAADGSLVTLHPAVHQRDIFLLNLAPGELCGQFPVCFVIFRYHYKAARCFIETMYYART